MKKIVLLFVMIFESFLCCYGQERKIAREINKACSYLITHVNASTLNSFKNKAEKNAVVDEHFGMGLVIRNEWMPSHGRMLKQLLFKSGINHRDAISSIILVSFYRKLNNIPIKLSKQLQLYSLVTRKGQSCEEQVKVIAVQHYSDHDIGDTITIYMPIKITFSVDSADTFRNAIGYEACDFINWKFDTQEDLLIKAIIRKKYFLVDKTNVFFSLYILKINRYDTRILGKDAVKNELIDFSLRGLKIE